MAFIRPCQADIEPCRTQLVAHRGYRWLAPPFWVFSTPTGRRPDGDPAVASGSVASRWRMAHESGEGREVVIFRLGWPLDVIKHRLPATLMSSGTEHITRDLDQPNIDAALPKITAWAETTMRRKE